MVKSRALASFVIDDRLSGPFFSALTASRFSGQSWIWNFFTVHLLPLKSNLRKNYLFLHA